MLSESYHKDDVTFLLKDIFIKSTSVENKEKKIQSNSSHYSEMITYEKPPTPEYMSIFYSALNLNGEKFATHLVAMAKKLNDDYKNEIVIVSLARAGTPVGVILTKILRQRFARLVSHYTVSIIRDKGLDLNAIKFITDKHQPESIAFIDGWTGKGVIGQELKKSIAQFNKENFINISPYLYVVADISGTAHWAATSEDYLIPSAVLNSTISGLISRTILNKEHIGDNDFHGCMIYKELKEYDISSWFVETILKMTTEVDIESIKHEEINKYELEQISISTIESFLKYYNLDNRNYIKPGIGESTRVLLRRLPKEIVVKNMDNVNLQHLIHLAKQKNVPVKLDKNLQYNCIAIIELID